uniref:Gamma-glutamyltranspeptidase n=1 Tax=Colletotrichum fructicola (strain Nara gc5) TaxID=1213859 RepID=L2FR44_COLFN
MSDYTAAMISPETGAEVRSKISDFRTQNVSAYNPEGFESLETPGTSHLMVPETGVIMNNEMNDFSIPGSSNAFGYVPSPANYIRPGKRPLSSISPVIVEKPDGKLYFVIGAAPVALAEPRLHDQLSPNIINVEYSYDNSTISYLQSLGHNVTWVAPGSSSAQGVRLLENGTFEAAGEPRQKNSGGYAV